MDFARSPETTARILAAAASLPVLPAAPAGSTPAQAVR